MRLQGKAQLAPSVPAAAKRELFRFPNYYRGTFPRDFGRQAPPLPLQGETGGNATVTATQQSSIYMVWLDKLDVSGGFSAADQWRVQAGGE